MYDRAVVHEMSSAIVKIPYLIANGFGVSVPRCEQILIKAQTSGRGYSRYRNEPAVPVRPHNMSFG